MRLFKIAFVLAIYSVPALAFGQLKNQDPKHYNYASMLTKGYAQPGGIFGFLGLDPNKFSMTQSYSLSFMAAGGQGFGQGMYLNTMRYRFSQPLTLSLQWGILHEPFKGAGLPSAFGSGFFVSGASLDYAPSKNFKIGVQYSSYPRTGSYYGNSLLQRNRWQSFETVQHPEKENQ